MRRLVSMLLGRTKTMLRIKRTKQGPSTFGEKDGKRVEIPGPVATHYATAVSPRGSIDGWSAEEIKAVAVTNGTAQRVKAFYQSKKNVGQLAFEPVDVTGAELADAVAADDAIGAAEFAKLQAECKRLQAENAELTKQAIEAQQEAARFKAGMKEESGRAAQLLEELTAKRGEVSVLAAKGIELEAALQAATAPAQQQAQQAQAKKK